MGCHASTGVSAPAHKAAFAPPARGTLLAGVTGDKQFQVESTKQIIYPASAAEMWHKAMTEGPGSKVCALTDGEEMAVVFENLCADDEEMRMAVVLSEHHIPPRDWQVTCTADFMSLATGSSQSSEFRKHLSSGSTREWQATGRLPTQSSRSSGSSELRMYPGSGNSIRKLMPHERLEAAAASEF